MPGLRHGRPAPVPRRPLRAGVLAAAALVIAVSSFAVWQVWPANAVMFLNLRMGQWPQGAVLFALGVLGAAAGWLGDLPPVLARRLGWVAAAAVAVPLALRTSVAAASPPANGIGVLSPSGTSVTAGLAMPSASARLAVGGGSVWATSAARSHRLPHRSRHPGHHPGHPGGRGRRRQIR